MRFPWIPIRCYANRTVTLGQSGGVQREGYCGVLAFRSVEIDQQTGLSNNLILIIPYQGEYFKISLEKTLFFEGFLPKKERR